MSITVRGAHLDVFDWGAGEPVVFIQTALTADELMPLASDPALGDYHKVLYHRRGYAGSSATAGPGSIRRDASDCAALLTKLGIDHAHVVGLSFSGAIGLQLAADVPERIRSLIVIEPPPVHTPSSEEFRAANHQLIATRRAEGPEEALDELLTVVIGPDWRRVTEQQLPRSSAQMLQDACTFFDTDLPALLAWRFGLDDASRIRCPVLYVGGTDSGPWFAEVRQLMLTWIPDINDVLIDGADHSLALTHAPQIAAVFATFLGQHSS